MDLRSTRPYPVAHAEATLRASAGAVVGHYRVIRALGEGAMGLVLLARDTRLGRLVALKFLLDVDALTSARFRIEAWATASIAHENIVALYDVAEHRGLPYLVLEYVKGKTLLEWLDERPLVPGADEDGPRVGISPGRAAAMMLPVARALACAHEAGIVHRDLTPGNIMLADSGAVKVLDFGIAKLLGDARAALAATDRELVLTALTRSHIQLGTMPYMSPEHWGADLVDHRTDIWAVGIMLYEMVIGAHPLNTQSLWGMASVANLTVPMPSVRELRPDLGKLGAVIDRCLLKPKEARLESARELCAELEAIAEPRDSP